jgi:hypothetical protein
MVSKNLHDRLATHFDRKQIFMDIEGIDYGDNFIKTIKAKVSECDVLIAVIGLHWLTSTDKQGGRRLNNPEDFVRMEIATALKRDVQVIPVLVDGASMPISADLPEDLKALTSRNALSVSDTGFNDEIRRLIAAIERALGGVGINQGATQPPSAPPWDANRQNSVLRSVPRWSFIPFFLALFTWALPLWPLSQPHRTDYEYLFELFGSVLQHPGDFILILHLLRYLCPIVVIVSHWLMFPGKSILEMIISWMAFLLWAYPIINALLGLHYTWSEAIVFPRTLSSTILGVGAVMKTISWLQSRKPPVVKH